MLMAGAELHQNIKRNTNTQEKNSFEQLLLIASGISLKKLLQKKYLTNIKNINVNEIIHN